MAKLMVDGMEVGGTFTSGESGSTNASDHIYDNTNSENITSETVQGAIDELDKRISEQITLGKINDSNKLVESTDLNDILEVGQYYISTDAIAETCKNMPVPLAGTVLVGDSTNNHASVDGAFDRIMAYTTRTNETYTRYIYNNGTITTYSDWTKLVTVNELTDMTEGINNKSDIALITQTVGYTKKNLLKNVAPTVTIYGVTFTVNNDGSITADGTATDDVALNISDYSESNTSASHVENLASGKYILNGVMGGSSSTYFIQYRDVTRQLSQNAMDGDIEITVVNGNNVYTYIKIYAGTTVENLTFYPMIRSADIEDDTYEPYVDDVKTALDNKVDTSDVSIKCYNSISVLGLDKATATLVDIVNSLSDNSEIYLSVNTELYTSIDVPASGTGTLHVLKSTFDGVRIIVEYFVNGTGVKYFQGYSNANGPTGKWEKIATQSDLSNLNVKVERFDESTATLYLAPVK